MALDAKRQTIFAGVNYVFAPAPVLDSETFLKFKSVLARHGLAFDQSNQSASEGWALARAKPPLRVQVRLPAQPLGQVMVTSDWMEQDLAAFVDEAAIVSDAVFEVWPGDKQVVSRDATIRQLYDAGGIPAFSYLWERRLGQQKEQLAFLQRPVSGGGLRLMMPPEPADPDPVQGEVKIESFLRDPRKLFVEVSFLWPKPEPPVGQFQPKVLLVEVENFANSDVYEFLMLKGGSK